MKNVFAAAFLALLVAAMFSPSAAFAANALVVHDGSAVAPGPDIRTSLATRLTAKGFTVTSNAGLPAGALATYQQIWDLRYNNVVLTGTEVAAYLAYLQGGGSLFLMGENGNSFAARNNSLAAFVQTAGGGTITLAANSTGTQTVQPPFTGPTAVASVVYQSCGGVSSPLPKAAFVTRDASNAGAAVVWAPATMTNAAAGTLLLVLDVNFLQAAASAALQSLTDNIISYLAAPVAVVAADVSVALSQSTAAPAAGSNIVYTVTVTNAGPDAATDVILSNALPAGTTFTSVSAPAGWTVTSPAAGAGGTITATRANLPAAAPQVFTITSTVSGGIAAGTTLTNSPTVTATTADPAAANNTASVTATVAAAVPTLNEWVLILLAAVLGMIAVLRLRSS